MCDAEMEQVRQAALETVYPETGFAPEDPRLTPVGIRSWRTPSPHGRSVGPTRTTSSSTGWSRRWAREDYDKAGDHWTPMLKADMAVATLYGQLFANVGALPVKPA